MNLREKLDELRNNMLRDRSALIAGDDDKLWSDATLLRYIKDAEYRFARQALILQDNSTPAYTQVRLRTGVTSYALNPLVLGIYSARYDTQTQDLKRSGHSMLFQNPTQEFLTFDPSNPSEFTPGAPLAYYSDESLASGHRTTLSVFPAPSAAENDKVIYLRTFRLPKTLYTKAALASSDCGEIPEDYELDVLGWAAYRAQSNYDADGASTSSADRHKKRFEETVKEALKETRRKMFVPITAQYGSNGFSYTR
jgi:hypothetical protein